MRLWAGAFAIVIAAIVVGADTGHLGFLGFILKIPGGDKLGHFILFGLLSFLTNLAVFEWKPGEERRKLALRTSLVLAVLIGLEELSQRLFPRRSSNVIDLAASYMGVALFAWLALRVESRRRVKAIEMRHEP